MSTAPVFSKRTRGLTVPAEKYGKSVKAPKPSLLVNVAYRDAGNAFVRDSHFGVGPARLERHAHPFGRPGSGAETPAIDQTLRWFDHLELTRDPHHVAVGKLVRDAVATTHREIDGGLDTRHGLRAPPFLQLFGPSPGVEQTLRSGANRFTDDERD